MTWRLLQPNPRRFLAVWYTLWLGYELKGFFLNWLVRRQAIRVVWVPVTGWVEGLYLFIELAVVGGIVYQTWRFQRADWRLAIGYECYSLAEIGLSMLNPRLWTFALNRMWCAPLVLFGEHLSPCRSAIAWSGAAPIVASHLGFIAFYALMHHGLPLLVLLQAIRRDEPSAAV